jgi:SAM-dependent methyltransferase
MAETYTVLARVYKAVGLADASEELRQRLFGKIQSDGWLGRRILDLGCGIGEGCSWFSANGFRVTGVDQSEAMLNEARQAADEIGVTVDWQQGDIREVDAGTDYDLILALNTLNEMRSIRDLEMVFRAANQALSMEKLLAFDLMTIQGLAEHWGNADRVIYDDTQGLTLMVRSRFSFETSANTREYILFQQDGPGWRREDETHVLRGYALQAVGALLQRTGFRVQTVINPLFDTFDPYADETGQAIFLAIKERNI